MEQASQNTSQFYDDIASCYHLIYPDWQKSIERQGAFLQKIIHQRWDRTIRTILDATSGIGTQSIALAKLGFNVTASDLSPRAIERLKTEASRLELSIRSTVCDIRSLQSHHQQRFDLVMSCDNSLPHLNPKTELQHAIRQMYLCTQPGGGCLITLRDYAGEQKDSIQVHPYGIREVDGKKIVVFQTRDHHGDHYTLSIYFVEESGDGILNGRKFSSTYYPVSIPEVIRMMDNAGFANIERLDDVFYQPVLVGDRVD